MRSAEWFDLKAYDALSRATELKGDFPYEHQSWYQVHVRAHGSGLQLAKQLGSQVDIAWVIIREVVDSASLARGMASKLMSFLVSWLSRSYAQTRCSKCACYTALSYVCYLHKLCLLHSPLLYYDDFVPARSVLLQYCSHSMYAGISHQLY